MRKMKQIQLQMELRIGLLISLITIVAISSCQNQEPFEFVGKWQSLNDSNYSIVIGENFSFDQIRNNRKVSFEGLDKLNQLNIDIESMIVPWTNFEVREMTNSELFMHGRIEVVDQERIRIYFHKHHDILDFADEFYRNDNDEDLEEIMRKIGWKRGSTLNQGITKIDGGKS